MQYYKQTQLETMASEKAAAEFQLEKEIKRIQEAQVCLLAFYARLNNILCFSFLDVLLMLYEVIYILFVFIWCQHYLDQVEAERSRVSRRTWSSSWEEDTEMKTLEYVVSEFIVCWFEKGVGSQIYDLVVVIECIEQRLKLVHLDLSLLSSILISLLMLPSKQILSEIEIGSLAAL